jgi:hypothetical protein
VPKGIAWAGQLLVRLAPTGEPRPGPPEGGDLGDRVKVRIVEVAPRDGLQNESATVPTEDKVAFVDALSEVGYDEIEVSAFVSPRWIPQLADAEGVFARIRRRKGVRYAALVPNEQGFERALSRSSRRRRGPSTGRT